MGWVSIRRRRQEDLQRQIKFRRLLDQRNQKIMYD
jgi:hypothetical protein